MGTRCRLSSLLLFALCLTACRQAKVETYRVPKEKDPELPAMAGGDATPSAAPADGGTMASTAVPTAEGQALTWTAPPDWKLLPAKAMRKATYATPGPEGVGAELSVTAFPGDVGGELANLNRWRGQINVAPLDAGAVEAAVTRFKQGDLEVTVADFPNAAADGKEILGAIIPFQGGTWFFKLMGPKAAVQAQKDAFLTFVRSIREAKP